MNGITLIGGFEGIETTLNERDSGKVLLNHSTRLSGDIGRKGDSIDNSYHVVEIPKNIGNVILDGLIIEEGHARGVGDYAQGGGIWARNNFELYNCLIQYNSASTSGGGVYTEDLTLNLSNCIIFGNYSERGEESLVIRLIIFFSSAIIDNNQAEIGGGLYMDFTSSRISNTFFKSNRAIEGGGVFSTFIRAIFSDCTFEANSADKGEGCITIISMKLGE